MAILNIQKRCDECEKTRSELHMLRSEVQQALLDYQNLYEKVRTNLAKLAKRLREEERVSQEDENGEQDPLAKYRQMLVERKLGKRG